MTKPLILTAIQYCAVPNIEQNVATISYYLAELVKTKPTANNEHLVVLPECCLYFGGKDKDQLNLAIEQSSYLQQQLAALATQYQVYLVAGSLPIINVSGDKFTNSSIVFSPQGKELARYDKIHLFDVEVNDNEKQYLESKYTQAGTATSLLKLPFANLGQTICYDLRFAELYRTLTNAGADIITVPAAFTRITGKAHWQALLQARAIENQVYIIAAGQEGIHANGRETWGHSMIISPWGEIVAQIETGQGMISHLFEPELIAKVRRNIPVAAHNRFTINSSL